MTFGVGLACIVYTCEFLYMFGVAWLVLYPCVSIHDTCGGMACIVYVSFYTCLGWLGLYSL